MIFGSILPGGTYVANATSFRLHTETICINICLNISQILCFFVGRVLKQANSACVRRYRCPLSVIEDDEEAARVWGYCSWTTYKSKRQSLVIDDVFCRIQPSLNRGFYHLILHNSID